MAAGLGFKTFTTGEVLTAADTNGYLMQGVLVFASSAARAAAITSPQEGQYSYLKDTNSTEYYDGAAWIAAPIGDITGVTAGTGISGGGTSGTVTVTNSMATEITAAGDIIVGTGSGTFDNLPIGTTNQVLTADTTVSPYKVKWATPASSTPTYVGVSAYKSASQAITNTTFTAITFDTESFDTDAFHNNSTNTSRFTVPSGKAGKYLISGTVAFQAGTGAREVAYYKNGAALNYGPTLPAPAGALGAYIPISYVANLAVSDYIEIFVYQNSGGNLNCTHSETETSVQLSYLGA
jgi:hypothetical protein